MNPLTKRARLIAAYHHAFDSPEGKVVLADLVKYHGVMDPIYYTARGDGDAQALATAHAEGQRAVVLRIVQHLQLSLEQILEIAKDEERISGRQFDSDQE